MARGTRTTTRTSPAPKAPGRSSTEPKKAAAKPPPKAAAPKAVERPPAVSKDELRAQVEKLEQTVATLRTKGREATKAAKASAARIAELEDEVAMLEKRVASQTAAAKRSARRTATKGRGVDPGDAVPPGVVVEEPGAPDEEAEQAVENLEEHLGGTGGE